MEMIKTSLYCSIIFLFSLVIFFFIPIFNTVLLEITESCDIKGFKEWMVYETIEYYIFSIYFIICISLYLITNERILKKLYCVIAIKIIAVILFIIKILFLISSFFIIIDQSCVTKLIYIAYQISRIVIVIRILIEIWIIYKL